MRISYKSPSVLLGLSVLGGLIVQNPAAADDLDGFFAEYDALRVSTCTVDQNAARYHFQNMVAPSTVRAYSRLSQKGPVVIMTPGCHRVGMPIAIASTGQVRAVSPNNGRIMIRTSSVQTNPTLAARAVATPEVVPPAYQQVVAWNN